MLNREVCAACLESVGYLDEAVIARQGKRFYCPEVTVEDVERGAESLYELPINCPRKFEHAVALAGGYK